MDITLTHPQGGLPKHFPNSRLRNTLIRKSRRKCVPEVMESEVLKLCVNACTRESVLNILDTYACARIGKDPIRTARVRSKRRSQR